MAIKHLVSLLLIFSFSETLCQQLTVVNSKETFYMKGSKIKKGDHINKNKKIKINEGGQLGLAYNRWTFYLEPGTYDIDSVLNAQKQRKEYIIDDSIYSILKKENLINCKNTGIQCNNVSEIFNPNYNRKDNTLTAKGDSVLLQWDDRSYYNDNYYIVFSNLFDELTHLEITNKREIKIDLKPLRKEKILMYKVISKDCFESDLMAIRIE
jgi:hypothetical protein